jgi:hypothetical protein
VKGAGFVHRGADDGVADFFLDRHRFAGEHGLVDVRHTFGDLAIDGDLLTGTNDDDFRKGDF